MANPEPAAGPPPTRTIALGSAALTDGFRLIGIETVPDATPATLEDLLAQLVRNNERALLFVEDPLARSNGPWLRRVREEGGAIVITEVPSLHAPQEYHPLVEDLVRSVLGPDALEPRS
jgi:vacuolar-type H+-ATPase subunit F/Vma7